MLQKTAKISINTRKEIGTLSHNWNYIGMDECNYIHTPEGEAVLEKFSSFQEKPYYVRPHFLFCNGNLHGTYKWGSTNIYTEDNGGNPIYDFKTVDRIFDTIKKYGMKPFVELGFMPLDLVDAKYISGEDKNSKIKWNLFGNYKNTYHSCPPKDYNKWQNLVYELVVHCKERYGREEVESWYFELWNEPDIFYWRGTDEEYIKLYDYTAAGVEQALPTAKIGGPSVTGIVKGAGNEKLLDSFLKHCSSGTNYANGKKGTRLDFVTFHVKGGGFPFEIDARKESPSVKKMLSELTNGLDTIKKHGYIDKEIVLSEADPDGWAAGGIYDNVNMNYRNTAYYPSFVAASFHHMEMIARKYNADVRPLTWAFMFRGERCFEGTRAFVTQGVEKPVINYFRLAAMMGEKEIEFKSSCAQDRTEIEDPWSEELPAEINGYATMDDGVMKALVYCHHDNQWSEKGSVKVDVEVCGVDKKACEITLYQVDNNNCSSYTAWKEMGSPEYPDKTQINSLKKASELIPIVDKETVETKDGTIKIQLELPIHCICLIVAN